MQGEHAGEGKLVSHTVVTGNANNLGFPREREQERSKGNRRGKKEKRDITSRREII